MWIFDIFKCKKEENPDKISTDNPLKNEYNLYLEELNKLRKKCEDNQIDFEKIKESIAFSPLPETFEEYCKIENPSFNLNLLESKIKNEIQIKKDTESLKGYNKATYSHNTIARDAFKSSNGSMSNSDELSRF